MKNKQIDKFLDELRGPEQGAEDIAILTMGSLSNNEALGRIKANQYLKTFMERLDEIDLPDELIVDDGDAGTPTTEWERLRKDFYSALAEAENTAFKRGFDLALMLEGKKPVFGRLPGRVMEWLLNVYGIEENEGSEE